MSADRRPDRRPAPEQWPAVFRAMRKMQPHLLPLDFDGRITLLCALLMQEVCALPPSERGPELRRLQADLPGILHATEEGMRRALAENAREGL